MTMMSADLRYWTIKARSATAVSICYGVGSGVVSPLRVQGWKGTCILSPFFGLKPGAGASRFGATPAGLLSPLVCSLTVCI
jgi:hypothetical protein